MFKQLSPCMGCTERHLACHDSCPKYKEWLVIWEDKEVLEVISKRTRRRRVLKKYINNDLAR